MKDRNRTTGQSGRSRPVALVVAAIAVGAFAFAGSVTLRTQAAATPGSSVERTATGEGATLYFPAQYVNQATEIEPMIPTF